MNSYDVLNGRITSLRTQSKGSTERMNEGDLSSVMCGGESRTEITLAIHYKWPV